MKKNLTLIVLIISFLFIGSLTSCIVVKKDNGKHKGWYKQSNPSSNSKNGNGSQKSNGKSGEKSKGKSGEKSKGKSK